MRKVCCAVFMPIVISLLFLSGCDSEEIAVDYGATSRNWDKHLNADELAVYDFQVDQELAFEIGRAVLDSVFGADTLYQEITVWKVIYNEKYEAYLVSKTMGGMTVGYEYAVIISKTDGRVLSMWLGE